MRKQTLTRCISVFLASVFLIVALACMPISVHGIIDKMDELTSKYDEKMKAQEPAIAAYQVLTEQFGLLESGFPDYPEGYSGEFIDDDSSPMYPAVYVGFSPKLN